MISNRELGMDDYIAIARRRMAWVVIPALIAPLVGFLISFALTPKYTSRSVLLVEGQMVPSGYVKPIVTERVSDRMTTLEQNVLSRSRLQALVSRLGLVRKGHGVDDIVDQIRSNVLVTEADLGKSQGPPGAPYERKGPGGTADVAGFNVSYTTDNPRDAQQVCAEITSLLLAENVELREQVAKSTTDFLTRQVEQAKQNLDDLDAKLSRFKIEHFGRLPGDADNNSKMVMSLDAQLDAITQTLSRLEQDKSYSEMLLSQELAAWKSSESSPTFPTLRQQLLKLQNQLVILQTRYTDDFPDVVKTKKEIEHLQAKLKQINSDAEKSDAERDATVPREGARLEPPEIMRLREQIHRSEGAIERATSEQERVQKQIDQYQGRLSLSPEIEEEYKQLTRDNTTAHNIYDGLLTNKSDAEIQTEMERSQEGEQLKLMDPANLPNAPSFPVRWMFALYGFGAGLGIGLCIGIWVELKDKAIRDEADVLAALELPMLGAVPWVGIESHRKGWRNGFRRSALAQMEQRTG